jgi:hypothetical protein
MPAGLIRWAYIIADHHRKQCEKLNNFNMLLDCLGPLKELALPSGIEPLSPP